MRISILSTFLLLSLNSFGQTDLNTIKVFDGTLANCKSVSDTTHIKNRLGAYRVKALSAQVENDNITFKLAFTFLFCSKDESRIGFKFQSPLKTNRFNAINREASDIDYVVKRAGFKIFKDGDYRLLSNIDLVDKAVQVHTVSLPLQSVLNANKENQGNFDLFIEKDVRIEDSVTGELLLSQLKSFGNFRVHFEINENNKVLIK